ncbi:MAG: hypothetical protein H6577_06300 [Lewinellaceae bacterium]|nr:hypothetical protein [Saprospiraceae bacterium]MCB9337719.1 hypothetical protein [Lewinellaceae bacterium]
MRLIFIVAISVFLAKTTAAQVSAKTTVDSTHMLIGDQMRLHVEVSQQNGIVVQPIRPRVDEGSALEFLAETRWDTLKGGNSLLLRKDLLFTAWDSGYQRVPPISVVFQEGKKLDSVRTNDIPIFVELPTADSTLADIKPIILEPATWKDYLPHIGTLVALLILAVLYFATRKNRKKEDLPQPPTVFIPPHEQALQQLKTLKDQKLWQRGELKSYHSELTHIVREYLEKRYAVQALEQTTDEILQQLKQTGFDSSLSEKLTTLLQTADLVKFAKAEPPADYHDRAMSDAEAFVRETKLVLVSPDSTDQTDAQ